jgi:hypothetical protein
VAEAGARVNQATSDKKAAESQVQVADASLQMAKVFVRHTRMEECPFQTLTGFFMQSLERRASIGDL